MTQTIFRSHPSKDFTVIPNALLRDSRLSLDMRGLLVSLLQLPEDWTVHLEHLADHFGVGKDKMQSLMRKLIEAGYVVRTEVRDGDSQKWRGTVYHIYDRPQGMGEPANANKPQPENPATGRTSVNPKKVSRPKAARSTNEPQPDLPSPENPPLLRTNNTKPPSEELDAPQGALEGKAGEDHTSKPSSLNGQIWNEGKAIVPQAQWACIGRWLKRVKDRPKGFETLLGIIATARNQGTGDPVPYITAALNREFPPLPDPKTFTRARWELMVRAAMNLKTWETYLGPRPGERGCLVPADLVTPELLRAVSVRRAA
jgi:hypothetical protein